MSNPFAPPPNHLAQAIQKALEAHQRGQFDDAEKGYRKILKTWPDHFDALHLYGMLQFQRGKPNDALKLITQALKLAPRSADAQSNLGMVLATLKRTADALASFDKALAVEPNNVGALVNRGRVLVETGRAEEGLASLDKALAREPRHIEARLNRGNALFQLRRHDEAVREYDQALAFQPGHPGAHFNRGNALFAQNLAAEAVEAFDRVLLSNPKSETAWNSRGVALQALGRNPDAIASFDRALALKPNYPDAHFNKSLSLLAMGDYPQGFTEYEWRWKRTGMPEPRIYREPLWTGAQELSGKTLLVHAEQGLGDTIQFARYVPQLAAMGANIILQVQPELKSWLSGIEGVSQVIARGEPEPKFDLQSPMGRLPLAFKTEISTVPAAIPYLTAPADRVESWRTRLPAGGKPRIALAWGGSLMHANDQNRSMPLSAILPLLAADVQFISLQRELRSGDERILVDEPRLMHLGGEISDFADTAAIVSLCDLVISVDTSVAHVAGALGRPLWMLIACAPDWRWTLDGASPWYPKAWPFRQKRPGDWAGVISDVSVALQQALARPA